MMVHSQVLVIVASLMMTCSSGIAATPLRTSVLREANRILSYSNVSYVYGGSKLSSHDACDNCTACLTVNTPYKDKRFEVCPVCKSCSLDCSHFITLVFKRAGLKTSYLTTLQMRALADSELRKSYGWISLGARETRALPGDLLVYPGHVVMVEKVTRAGFGDIIHATSGKEVRGPGQGIQRQRSVNFKRYRGPLQRVLRHKELQKELRKNLSPRYGVRRTR